MTLKLLKYEFKNNYKRYTGLYIATLIAAVLMGLSSVWIDKNGATGSIFMLFFVLFSVLFVGLIVACFMISMIQGVVSYHRSMFKSESYITHAVPASTNEILISKLLGACLWTIISFVVAFVALLVYLLVTMVILDLSSLIDGIKLLFSNLYFEDLLSFFLEILKYTPIMLTSLVSFFLTLFFCDTIVQTQKTPNHRVVLSCVAFIVISYLLSFIQSILGFDFFSFESQSALIIKSTLFNVAEIIVFYLGCKWVIDKKMEV